MVKVLKTGFFPPKFFPLGELNLMIQLYIYIYFEIKINDHQGHEAFEHVFFFFSSEKEMKNLWGYFINK